MYIKSFLKNIYKKILYGYKSSSKSYIKYLQKRGVAIGKNVTFYEPNTNYIDTQKSWMIEIGNNVEITRGVVIITHDYAWSVIKQLNGKIIGSRSKVSIGNNVFIGMNTVILQGVTIGDNVIIGANTLVNRDIPSNSIVAGNPGKVISNVNQYIEKREKKQIFEAKELFVEYYNKYNEIPPKEIFDEFFWIFERRNKEKLPKKFIEKMKLTGNEEISNKLFFETEPYFDGYNQFIKYCLEGEKR